MNKRLRKLKSYAPSEDIHHNEFYQISKDDYDWLLEQAENFEEVFNVVVEFKSGKTSLGEFIDNIYILIRS